MPTLRSFFPVPRRRAMRMVVAGLTGCAMLWTQASAQVLDPSNPLMPNLGLQSTNPVPAASSSVPRASTPTPAAAPLLEAPILGPQGFDYRSNLQSDVFGAQLFTGSFARQGATQFNPDYLIASGDTLQVRLWGAYEFDNQLVVDPQGNVFLPHVGPVTVRGVRNQELQGVVDTAVRRVFRANVNSYASLAAAQPVRVFVSGFVHRPGLYSGTSMDSLLHYLDQAGGIDPERGSFLNVQVKRGATVRATVNLYDFLLDGRMPLTQLGSGDVIFVGARQGSIKVSGLAESTKRFEFGASKPTVGDIARIAKPRATATHVRVIRNTGSVRNIDYLALGEASAVVLNSGDEVEFTADKKPGTISVRVEGEHNSAQEYVLPYGTRMGDLLKQIQFNVRSDVESIQLFRLSVRDRQKTMLATSLKGLESSVLTARSGTVDEARLRKEEADLILQWVDRAKTIEPTGQVLIAQASQRDQLLLESGDIVRVPARDGLVVISGEVLFPNAVAFDTRFTLQDYVTKAGGYTQSADTSRVIIAHRDGSFEEGLKAQVRPGDEVLVLPKLDDKPRQFWKDITQIIYQFAVTAKIALGL